MKLSRVSVVASGGGVPRRLFVVGVVSVVVALGVSACTGPSSGPSGSSTSAVANIEQYIGNPSPAVCGGRTYTFGYNTFSDTEEFAVNLWNGLQKVAKDLGCVKLTKLSDNLDPSVAVQNAQIFAQQKVDGALLFNVLDAAGPGQVQVLQQAGIPSVSIVVESPGETFVTNDDSKDGESAGVALGKAYLAKGLKSPVHAIIGRFDSQGKTGKARMDGAKKGLEETVPGIVIHQFETKADPPQAQSGTAAILPTIPADATILMTGINDGVVNAMLQGARQAGVQSRTLVAGIGAVNPGGLQFVCQNAEYIGAQGFFPENWAKYMIPALIARVQGAKIEHQYTVKTEFIDRAKIADFYPDFKCNK